MTLDPNNWFSTYFGTGFIIAVAIVYVISLTVGIKDYYIWRDFSSGNPIGIMVLVMTGADLFLAIATLVGYVLINAAEFVGLVRFIE